jgi:hypothetical protein
MDDLWRVTTRYKNTSEHMLWFGEKAISSLRIFEMGDGVGVLKTQINYQTFTGEGNKYQRPDPTNFGYTFIKQGYLPEKLEFNVPSNKSSVEAIVTLKRDPNEAIETAPYIQTYQRLRFELSDERKNEEMSTANQQRISRIEKELEQAAQLAIAAGDNKAAARIYIRMRYLPSIRLDNGDGISGYSHVDRESARSKRAWELARQLDPDNLFIHIHTIYEHGDNRADLPLKDWQKSMASHMDEFIAKHGLAVWPAIYDARASFYKLIGDVNKSKQLYLEAAKLEPKYKVWSKELK